MSAQYRATLRDWQEIQLAASCSGTLANCLLELRDRVLTMDACIRDIYEQLDRLKTLHESNWSRIVKLEEGPAVAEARGQGSVANIVMTEENLLELMPEAMRDEFSYASKVCCDATGGQVPPGIFRTCLNTAALEYARTTYELGLEHGVAIAKGQLGSDAEALT
jgi:hypothetical protein